MIYVKNTLRVVLFSVFALLFHYVLPQHDVAMITGADVKRHDFTSFNRLFYAQADSGTTEYATRDIRWIYTTKKRTWLLGFVRRDSEKVMVYRNEDTGWIWPPYFKFDSSDLQADALRYVSTADNPQWVVITHYGWRNRFITIFPNAIAIKPVEGPDVRVIPWFNITFFIFLVIAWFFLRAVWRQFRERTIDPAVAEAGAAWDRVDEKADETRGRIRRWLDTWRDKPKG